MGDDENILDVKLCKADFNENFIEAFLTQFDGAKGSKGEFPTCTSVEFFNHDAHMTNIEYGVHPQYSS
jgi:hypothetical protein